MTTYLGPVEPGNTDPAVAEGEVVDHDGADGDPLRGGARVRQADHRDEDDHADGQDGGRPDQHVAAADPLDRPRERKRAGREACVHHCGEELR